MLAKYLRGRTLLLLVALVLFIVLSPLFGRGAGHVIVAALYIVIPIAGIHAVSGTRRHATIAFILGLPAIAAALQTMYRPAAVPDPIAPISSALFYAYATVAILRNLMRSTQVTVQTVYGVVSVYLLIGFTWASLYAVLESFSPGSLSISSGSGGALRVPELLYFSFVTLTTLGYGDISPLTPAARSLAVLEAVTGVLFTATTIAGIVGIYSSRGARQSSKT